MPALVDLIPDVEPDGSEHGGPCPWCGGDDRFRVWQDQGAGDKGRYWCRQCDRTGDVINYLRGYKNLSFVEACEQAGLSHLVDGDSSPTSRSVKQKEQAAPRPQLPDYTEAQWKERTRAWKAMAAEEVRLRSLYKERRTAAREARDRDAFDRYQQKLDALVRQVIQREVEGQRQAGFVDADTQHLDRRVKVNG